MTFDQGAVIVVGALFTMLSAVCVKLWTMVKDVQRRCTACEKDRESMHGKLEAALKDLGKAEGLLLGISRCGVPSCPWRAPDPLPAACVTSEPL